MSTRREFLAGLAAGPLLAPNAASAADPPDSILSKPRLGAEFFLNNSETRDSVAPRGPAGGRVDRGARAGSLARSARPADGRPRGWRLSAPCRGKGLSAAADRKSTRLNSS